MARGRVPRSAERSRAQRASATAAPEGNDYVREQRSIERSEPWAMAVQEILLYVDRIPGSRIFASTGLHRSEFNMVRVLEVLNVKRQNIRKGLRLSLKDIIFKSQNDI